MFEHKTLQHLNQYFDELNRRPERGIYFYRINGYSQEIHDFLLRYCEAARVCGVIQEGKIPNPTEQNLSYYEEMMGGAFLPEESFIDRSLARWLPRMQEAARREIAASLADALWLLAKEGKNEYMQRNAYVKFMCWLYYRFERVAIYLGGSRIPKILYEGSVSNYEWRFLSILAHAGCDVVLLQKSGDDAYLRLDPASSVSLAYRDAALGPFPADFSIKKLRKESERKQRLERLYGNRPSLARCTNAWLPDAPEPFRDLLTSPAARGQDSRFFYNAFLLMEGVEDKLTYAGDCCRFRRSLVAGKRPVLILEREIPRPTPEEIGAIRRQEWTDGEKLLAALASQLPLGRDTEIGRLLTQAFLDILLPEAEKPGALRRLMNKGVFLLCWLRRYAEKLFTGWRPGQVPCLIYLGGAKDENEILFVRMMARLPVDVLLLNPDRHPLPEISDDTLLTLHRNESLSLTSYPEEGSRLSMGTAAYHAERELDSLMYEDSGMYRNQQYQKASSVRLQTMYEEIFLLWDQEMKYRPHFEVTGGVVHLPVIFAKVSGVKDGQTGTYWNDIRKLLGPDTFLIRQAPFLSGTDENPMRPHAPEFFRSGRLMKQKILSHPQYPYGFLRQEMQEYILEKLRLLIESREIAGTFTRGSEYTIISTVLHLPKEILRMIQRFDFTKKNPKLVYIHTSERTISLEDTILVSFLSLVGFDVLFFVPTGYESIEKYFAHADMEEHQIGEYLYDLTVPPLDASSRTPRRSWRDRIFKRG